MTTTVHDGQARPFRRQLGDMYRDALAWARLAFLFAVIAGMIGISLASLHYTGVALGRAAVRDARAAGRPILVTADHALATSGGERNGCLLRRGSGLRLGGDANGGSSMEATVTSVFDVPIPDDCRVGDIGRIDIDTLARWVSGKGR